MRMEGSASNALVDPQELTIVPLPAPGSSLGRLTAAVRAGDEPAFDRLYELYCDRLYRYLLVLTRGQEDSARDLLQATWTKVIRHLPHIEEEKKLWNWLATVARNCCLDTLRRRRRDPSALPPPEHPSASNEEARLFECMELALEALEPEERTVLNGFYFEGQSHQQLAQRVGTTAKAIESKLGRLRRALHRDILKRLQDEHA